MSQQRAPEQKPQSDASAVINLDDLEDFSDPLVVQDAPNGAGVEGEEEEDEVQFVGVTRPLSALIDLCGPSTSAAAAARSGTGIGTGNGNGSGSGPGSVAGPAAGAEAETHKDNNLEAGTSNPGQADSSGAAGSPAAPLECPICLQTCIHPARLPCGHIFCFLCVKGVAYKNRRCAMCRREIPAEFLDHPQLVNGIEDICATRATEDGYQWYYEGRNGWWQYDDRTSQDIEEAFKKGEKSCTILVAGYVYIVDLEQLVQQRQNEPTRCRRVKRDLATIPKKGVAGLRIEGNQVTSDTVFSRPASSTAPAPATAPAAPSSFICTIAATDAAIRIASDIIGSTLAQADELTRGLAASNISDDASGEQTNSIYPQDAGSSPASSPANSLQDLIMEDLRNTQQVIAHNQHTIDLIEQAFNDFQALSLRNYVDSSDDEEDDDNQNPAQILSLEQEQEQGQEAGEDQQPGESQQGG